jgi:hypothetical protein
MEQKRHTENIELEKEVLRRILLTDDAPIVSGYLSTFSSRDGRHVKRRKQYDINADIDVYVPKSIMFSQSHSLISSQYDENDDDNDGSYADYNDDNDAGDDEVEFDGLDEGHDDNDDDDDDDDYYDVVVDDDDVEERPMLVMKAASTTSVSSKKSRCRATPEIDQIILQVSHYY